MGQPGSGLFMIWVKPVGAIYDMGQGVGAIYDMGQGVGAIHDMGQGVGLFMIWVNGVYLRYGSTSRGYL